MPSTPDLIAALRRHFGYPGFRPGQEPLIRAALAGRDALGVLPTGGGKSVCFQLPAHLLEGTVVVVSPLISLMADQLGRAREAGLRAELLNSTLAGGERRRVLDEAEAGALDLLFLAPERFQVAAFRQRVARIPVSLLAIDEAHCISQWGHDFRPAYLALDRARAIVAAPVLALTATATPPVRCEIEEVLALRRPERVVLSFDRPNLSWAVLPARSHGAKVARMRALLHGRSGSTVVYAATRRAVEAIRRELAGRGHPAEAYHAGLSAERRARVQEDFLAGRRPLVVATNAFGMGIDQPDVRMVVHYQLPASLESYYQEAGRAGRDGEPAWCVALHGRRDLAVHRRFVDRSHPGVRTLQRLHRGLVRHLTPERSGEVRLGTVAGLLPHTADPRDGAAALRALERAGGVRLFGDPDPPEPTEGEGTGDRRGGSHPIQDPVEPGAHPVRLLLRSRLGTLDREREIRTRALKRIRSVRRFASGRMCRRRRLLAYFGEDHARSRCGRCDRCLPASGLPPGAADERRGGPARLLSALGLR